MNRPARVVFVLLVIGTLSAVNALYLETTIPLGVAQNPMWSPVGNKVYVTSTYSGVGTVRVIDGRTNSVTAVIPAADFPWLFALNPVDGKVYCTSPDVNQLNVICAYGDTLIRQVGLGGWPWALVYCARKNKLYVHADDDELLHVLDAHSDTIVACIPALFADQMLVQEQTDRLFVSLATEPGTLMVLDCAADTITALHQLAAFANGPLCIGLDGQVYLACRRQVEVFSPDGETHVATIPTSSRASTIAVYAPRESKVYINDPNVGILAIDCRGRTIVESIPLGVIAEYVRDAVFDTVHNMLYVLCHRQVLAIDTRNDSVVAVVNLPDRSASYALAWNPVNRRVYADDPWLHAVYVLRDTTSGVEEAPPGPFSASLAPTVVRGILRLRAPASGTLLDASGRTVLALRPGSNDLSRLAPGVYFVHSPIDNRHSTISKVVLTR